MEHQLEERSTFPEYGGTDVDRTSNMALGRLETGTRSVTNVWRSRRSGFGCGNFDTNEESGRNCNVTSKVAS
jgi:hypothetical protein